MRRCRCARSARAPARAAAAWQRVAGLARAKQVLDRAEREPAAVAGLADLARACDRARAGARRRARGPRPRRPARPRSRAPSQLCEPSARPSPAWSTPARAATCAQRRARPVSRRPRAARLVDLRRSPLGVAAAASQAFMLYHLYPPAVYKSPRRSERDAAARPSTCVRPRRSAERALLPGDPGRALALAQALLASRRCSTIIAACGATPGAAADGEPLTIQARAWAAQRGDRARRS